MKKIIFIIISVLSLNNQAFCQKSFYLNDLSLCFLAPETWRQNDKNKDFMTSIKLYNTKSDTITGSIKIAKELRYCTDNDTWNISEVQEYQRLKNELDIYEFSTEKLLINNNKFFKLNYKVLIKTSLSTKVMVVSDYKTSIMVEGRISYLSIVLASPQQYYNNDEIDFVAILNSLKKDCNQKPSTGYKYFDKIYRLPVLDNFEQLNQSSFSFMTLEKFTEFYCPVNGVNIKSLELLIDKDKKQNKIIHFYVIEENEAQSLTNENFMDYKVFLKETYNSENFNELLQDKLLDSLTFCKEYTTDLKNVYYSIISESKNTLSILNIVSYSLNNEIISKSVISNYFLLDSYIFFVKQISKFDDFDHLRINLLESHELREEFFKLNLNIQK